MVDYSLLDKAVNDNKRLSAENIKLRAKLDMAIADMKHIADSIESCTTIAGDDYTISDFELGRCDVCTKDCHYTDEGCAFRWRGIDEPPKED